MTDQPEANPPGTPPPAAVAPVEFVSQDRFHAMTHVADALSHVAAGIKARLLKVLESLTHRGPVHVTIPAAAAPSEPHDPLRPADGAFEVKPVGEAPAATEASKNP